MNTDLNTSRRIFAVKRRAETGISAEERELLRYVADARNEWIEASTNFEHAYEEKLIDYYTYKMKACEARYTYFIKVAKEKGLKSILSQHIEDMRLGMASSD